MLAWRMAVKANTELKSNFSTKFVSHYFFMLINIFFTCRDVSAK